MLKNEKNRTMRENYSLLHYPHPNRQGICSILMNFYTLQKDIKQPKDGAPLYSAFHSIIIATLPGMQVSSHLMLYTLFIAGVLPQLQNHIAMPQCDY